MGKLSWHRRRQWLPDRPASLATFAGHTAPVYSALWSPHSPDSFATASADCTLGVRTRTRIAPTCSGSIGPSPWLSHLAAVAWMQIWDIKSPRPVQKIRAHDNEVLSIDWNKYKPYMIATGSVDTSVRVRRAGNGRGPRAVL